MENTKEYQDFIKGLKPNSNYLKEWDKLVRKELKKKGFYNK